VYEELKCGDIIDHWKRRKPDMLYLRVFSSLPL